MAINPGSKYPGQTTTPDADYPYGGARNDLTPDDGTGFPLEEDWVNDWLGFAQYVLQQSGITPSGSPETAQVSQVMQGIQRLQSRVSWTIPSLLGSGLTISGAGIPALAALSDTDVACFDIGTGNLQTYRFNGLIWATVGSALSVGTSSQRSMTALASTDVVLFAGTALQVYRFNGSTWSTVGSSLNTGMNGVTAIAALNSTDVACFSSVTDELRTYRFSGSTWSQVGSSLSITGAGTPAITALNGADVALIDHSRRLLETYRFDGSTWAIVGSGLSLSGTGFFAITPLNPTDVAMYDGDSQIRTYRFSGSAWAEVGSGIATGSVGPSHALTTLNSTDIVYFDQNLDKIQAFRCGFALPGSSPYRPF